MIEQIKKEECTGCKMCADICPKQSISFECDKNGFWYPKVDDESCIKCGLCLKKCPSLNYAVPNEYKEPDVYAVWSKDKEVRMSSTSGGVFWEVASFFIEQGGCVAGCIFDSDWKSARHIIGNHMDDLEKLKGSKYFQSDTEGIYLKVKKELENQRMVLFCGTPCQNAALHSFLGRTYDNLYFMDFICRSINSPLAFREYIKELEDINGSKAKEVQLKNKKYGWNSLATRICFENGKECVEVKDNNYWVKGFISNDLYTRESCYQCRYRQLPRVTADITIGDFWGINGQSSENMFRGISVVLLNSERGKDLFSKVKDRLVCQHRKIAEVLPGNPALLKNPVKTKKQDKFFELIQNHSFTDSVKHCLKGNSMNKYIRKVSGACRKMKHICRFVFRSNISLPKYIYYNYFCRHIIRSGKSRVLPHKRTIINFGKNSKIYLSGRNLEIGFNQLRGSKSETHIRLDENAVWNCKNGGLLFYDTVLEIKSNAEFSSGFFSMNGGSVIIAHHRILFGEDVMIGRNVIIYDSDFHSLLDENGIAYNVPKEVIIEDHVWLTSNITVLKGVVIGKDSLITAQTVINKNIPQHSIVAGKSAGKVIKDEVSWDRQTCPL